MTLCSPLRGEGWLVLPGEVPPTRLRPGDTAVVRGPRSFSFVDAIDTVTNHPDATVCAADPTAVVGRDPADAPEGSSSLMVA